MGKPEATRRSCRRPPGLTSGEVIRRSRSAARWVAEGEHADVEALPVDGLLRLQPHRHGARGPSARAGRGLARPPRARPRRARSHRGAPRRPAARGRRRISTRRARASTSCASWSTRSAPRCGPAAWATSASRPTTIDDRHPTQRHSGDELNEPQAEAAAHAREGPAAGLRGRGQRQDARHHLPHREPARVGARAARGASSR